MRSAGDYANDALKLDGGQMPESDKAPSPPPEQVVEYHHRKCAAFGCPMPGTIGSGSTWRCRFHFNQGPDANDKITLRVKQNIHAIRFLNRLMRATAYDFETYREKYSSKTLPPEEGENLHHYRMRVKSWIDRQVFTGKEEG
ncbi:MAG: hypothetical protein N0E44_18825 [Candidatus Thiodiazotropha lotti]|nr:hypothetical protein [Candidatus Thiodiazotropha lotti]MCW4221939.1 hypothetical protein [Candidatus Thiodiazotropha lotti]